MAASKGGNKKSGVRQVRNVPVMTAGPATIRGIAEVITVIIARIGWPGTALIVGYQFVQEYASEEQKSAIIDLYVLGKGINAVYPMLFVVATCALVILGQHWVYKRKLKVKSGEIDRLSKWKSEHQRHSINAHLHHTKVKEG